MFTGIVKHIGQIRAVNHLPALMRYGVGLPPPFLDGLEVGASVSIDGVCQTVVGLQEGEVFFEAIEETLQRTTLFQLQGGTEVHVERSARLGDEIGGHLLSGHVYGVVKIQSIESQGYRYILTLAVHPQWLKYLFSKGYVALNGCSLTVVDVDPTGFFTVHLIPETLRSTTFLSKNQGDNLNIEFDSLTLAVVDTVERLQKENIQR